MLWTTRDRFENKMNEFTDNHSSELEGATINFTAAWNQLTSLSVTNCDNLRRQMAADSEVDPLTISDTDLAVWIIGMNDGNWWINAEVTA